MTEKLLDNDTLDQRITGALARSPRTFAELHEFVGYGPVDRLKRSTQERHLDRRLQALRRSGAICFAKGKWSIGS